MMSFVSVRRPCKSEFIEMGQVESASTGIGMVKREWAVRLPSRRRAVMAEEATQRATFTTNSCCNGIADISFPTPSCAVEEKQHSLIIPDRVHHSVKYMLLLNNKGLVACICQLCHCLCIICRLVLKDSVAMQNVPLLLWSGH